MVPASLGAGADAGAFAAVGDGEGGAAFELQAATTSAPRATKTGSLMTPGLCHRPSDDGRESPARRCAAAAVGLAVSVGQYLPTLLAGSGRFPTLTTEAVTLSSGGDPRVIGLYAVLQMALPLAGFTLAMAMASGGLRKAGAKGVA